MKSVHFVKIVLVLFIAAIGAVIAASAFAAGPTGASPTDPLMVPTTAQTIAPQTTLWFYFDYAVGTSGGGGGPGGGPGGGRAGPGGSSDAGAKANVTVDAKGVGGVAMAIYTPAQAADWLKDPAVEPVGRGTPYQDPACDTVTHDLFWSGAFNTSGRYLIGIRNSNRNAVSLTLKVTGDSVTLYPTPVPTATPALEVPITATPVPTGTLQGKLVFEATTGGDIYTVNGDGSNLTRVTRGIDPSWSPDGKRITFTRWDNTGAGVYIANADGSNERLVYGTSKARWPRCSPDGKYIVFSQDKTKGDDSSVWKLGVVEVATGRLSEPQCSQQCFSPNWTPDSANIVYIDPSAGIPTTNLFKGPATRLGPNATYFDTGANIARPVTDWPPMQNAEMNPNGSQIVYAMQSQDRWELNTINSDGNGQTGITSPDRILSILFDKVIHNVTSTWSPDNRQILFLSDRNGKWEFFVTDGNGTNTKQVLKNVSNQLSLQFGYNNERIMDWTQ